MEDYEIVGYICIGILTFMAGLVTGIAFVGLQQPTQYTSGYCAAIGGERLTDETCNVNGAVVEVQR